MSRHSSRSASPPPIINDDPSNRLTIIGEPYKVHDGKNNRWFVPCRCQCGTVKSYRVDGLRSGDVRSCGCLQRERATANVLAAKFCGKPRVDPGRAILAELYLDQGLTTLAIAKRYGVADSSVSRWLKDHGIESRRFPLPASGIKPPDADTLRKLVHEDYLSYKEISVLYGAHISAVSGWLRKYGIPKSGYRQGRYKGHAPALPDAETLRCLYDEGESLAFIGERYGVTEIVISRLCKEYGIDRRPAGYRGGRRYACDNGLEVRSKYEQKVANWLASHGIEFEYEPRLPFARRSLSDFLVGDRYIEIWGIATEKYLARRDRKRALYREHGLTLIELLPADFHGNASGMKEHLSVLLGPDGP